MWLVDDPVAHTIVAATAVAVIVGELLATAVGRGLDRRRPPAGSLSRRDRGTRLAVGLGVYLGIIAAIVIGKSPGLRGYANTWWTLGAGIAVVVAGAALRDWSIVSLGRYFRRVVTIEPGQRIVRRGPYRVLRHPSYAGLVLVIGGFGLALGSWLGAAAALLLTFVGMLPRILVEERALAEAFPTEYPAYAGSTARMIPHVW